MAYYGNAFDTLTGGGAGALDALDVTLANKGAGIKDGDIAMVCTGTYLYTYKADAGSGAAESVPDVIAPDFSGGSAYTGPLRWILQRVPQTNTVPTGTIVPWSGVYFADTANGSPVDVLGNDVAAINALLNPDGWYVCDGSEINVPGSSKYDGTGRHLPNLTGKRFVTGDASAGSVGGNNTTSHTHQVDIDGFASGSRTLVINHLPPHAHQYPWGTTGGSSGYIQSGNQSDGNNQFSPNTTTVGGGVAHNHWINPPETTSGGPSDTNNMPAYLTMVYIEKVI